MFPSYAVPARSNLFSPSNMADEATELLLCMREKTLPWSKTLYFFISSVHFTRICNIIRCFTVLSQFWRILFTLYWLKSHPITWHPFNWFGRYFSHRVCTYFSDDRSSGSSIGSSIGSFFFLLLLFRLHATFVSNAVSVVCIRCRFYRITELSEHRIWCCYFSATAIFIMCEGIAECK